MTIDTHNLPIRPRVAFFALDGVQSLDVTGPMEAFAVANRFGATYDLLLASEHGNPIRTHAGLTLGPAPRLAELSPDIDTLVLCGGSEEAMISAYEEGTLPKLLREAAGRSRRIVSICTGAFVLAATGLLDGRRAATHWSSAARFRQMFPQVELDADVIFVADPPYYSSAGVTAGIDLSLALIEADHGPRMALSIARELVLFLRRPGGQAQFSAGVSIPAQGPAPIVALATRILEDPSGRLNGEGRQVYDLARSVNMSERSFFRSFSKVIGITPAKFVEEARVNRAKTLLEETEDLLDQVSYEAGFGSVDALLRSFHRNVGVTPAMYRERFKIGGGAPQSGRASLRF